MKYILITMLAINTIAISLWFIKSISNLKCRINKMRPTFRSLHIPVGSTLVFTDNPSITCQTTNHINTVEYAYTKCHLDELTAFLLPSADTQPINHFTYNGKLLSDIYTN